MKIGELFQVARECRGLTLRELDKRVGIGHAVISQIETGHIKNPSWKNVVRLAKALNVKLDRLAACDETAGTPELTPSDTGEQND